MNNINFKLGGLHCEACVKLVTSRFKKIPGVSDVKIDFKSGQAEVTSSKEIDLEILRESLDGFDYSITK